jgi:GrpB-like predicted nucleotidyltransferase (UPF0157 family)/8-oxo-dGTP pyrophosphatase MutT (NUDIX family)
MILGLKRETVELYDHDPEWETAAVKTIAQLKSIFGAAAVDIQHVGSTAIRSIKAKPIIDISVGVKSFDSILPLISILEDRGFYKSKLHAVSNDILLCAGNKDADTRTYHIHIVIYGSAQWKNYIRFRDYLNANSTAAHDYEITKSALAMKYPNDRNAYTEGKEKVISQILRKAQVWAFLGTIVNITVDRPAGTYHPQTNTVFYSINYGYIEDEIAPDGSGLDVYILGVSEPLKTFTGRVIGIVHREDDTEDKLVTAPDGMVFTQNEIGEAVHFVEQFYKTTVEAIFHKSAGMIVYRFMNDEPEYLVLFQHRSRTWSFPKGHMNAFETEEQAARREVWEEIGLDLTPLPNFRTEITYPVDGITKTVAFFLAELEGEPKPDYDEITQYRLVNKDEVVRLISNRDYMAILEQVEKAIILEEKYENS